MIVAVLAALLATTGVAEPSDRFDRVAGAFNLADTPAGRRRAARILVDSGARPLDDGRDLGVAWIGRAVRAPVYRNRALGPGYRQVSIAPGGAARFSQVFLAGQRARVAVVPDRAARFDLAVSDEDGATRCMGAKPGACDWVPLWTTRFNIEVRNSGTATTTYYIVVE